MKRITTLVMLMLTIMSFSQKKANGTIYVNHPAIAVVDAMTKAFVAGDSDKVATYLAADFKEINGTNTNSGDKGIDRAAFAKKSKNWHDQIEYFSLVNTKGTYPDALEYKDDDQKDVIWVQDWQDLKGMDKKTGVKISMPMHRIYAINKDNKIKTIITYLNSSPSNEIGDSNAERTNGTIYNHHENINTIRKMMYGFENKDFSNCYSYYDKDAKFFDMNATDGKEMTLDEVKANDQALLKNFELTSIDMVGYPDYLHYEMSDSRVVLSWWTFNLIRKSDKKVIALPVHLQDNFNATGKIISEAAYYSATALK